MRERYSALAALNFEGDPDLQEYQECYSDTLKGAISKAEAISVTGEAYQLCLERWRPCYNRWEIIERFYQ